MATFPAHLLPAPRVAGYGITPTDMVDRTDMEAGNVLARLRSAADRDVVPIVWTFSDRQLAIFRAWHKLHAAGGSGWFDMIVLDGWHGQIMRTCRFASGVAIKYVPHLHWEVTTSVELQDVVRTTLDLANLSLGIMEKDVALLWAPTTQADVLVSKIGPDAEFAATGVQYDQDGVSLGVVAALHDAGAWIGPAYSNLFTAGTPAVQTKTLTAQKYTVWCDAGSVVCGSYGTATADAPLTFTATAGDCTFTPTGVTKWMLTATVAPMPYVAPGTSVASAAGSTTNGLSWEMSAEMTAALSGACTVAALVTMGAASSSDTASSAMLSVRNSNNADLIYCYYSASGALSTRSYDGVVAASMPVLGWSRNEQHLKVVQTNVAATRFRVGCKRIGIDSAVQWSHTGDESTWPVYDGSFNPLTHLRAGYGNTVPLWLKAVMVSKTGGLTDAQIEERVYA